MEIDEAVKLTEDRLEHEGDTMDELLKHFRHDVSHSLIGDYEWGQILTQARVLPITMGALPFGFEIPLHEHTPTADLGASLASGTKSADFFKKRCLGHEGDDTANAITTLFDQIEEKESVLQDIVGRKLMLEYDIGSRSNPNYSVPGMFLRPGERPIEGDRDQANDVSTVVDALVSCVGWERNEDERMSVRRTYSAQPGDTRMDSFGVFASRKRSVRLAVMGFKSQSDIDAYLKSIGWPGDVSTVNTVMARFRERVNVVRTGLNIDAERDGVGPTLGLTLIVKQRYTKDSRYWLDGLTDWDPFLEALSHESLVAKRKLQELSSWAAKPTMLFGKSGRYVLLRGIHHIKLVIDANQLLKVKAYLYMILSGALSN